MVTHIIASNLTPKKKIEFAKYRIVKPAWVVDSVEAGRLLPWGDYRLIDEGAGQRVLGFENGKVSSQVNRKAEGYKGETDRSWYTSQVREVAARVDGGAHDLHVPPSSESLVGQKCSPDSVVERLSASPLRNHADKEINHGTGLNSEHVAGNTDRSTSLDEQTLYQSKSDLKGSDTRSTELPTSEEPPAQVQEVNEEYSAEPCQESNKSHDMTTKDQEVGAPSAANVYDVDQRAVLPVLERPYDDPFNVDLSHERTTTDMPQASKINTKIKDLQAMTAEEHNAVLLADPNIWKSTVVNPGFLKQYYEESRLHHLSAWKAALKSQLQALASEKSASQKAREKRKPGARRYILHVDFDSFFAAVSVVVAHGNGSGAEIASCNYPARKFGIKNGMWMKYAQKMCPELIVLPYDFKAYEDASRSFYDAIIATGGLVQSVSVDEALVDVSSQCTAAGGHDGQGIHEGSVWREQAKADEIAQNVRDKVK